MIKETHTLNIRGNVVTSWTDGYCYKPVSSTHNEIMYATADCLAQMYAGQPRKIPAKIGFIFSTTTGTVTVPTSKGTTWKDLEDMCDDTSVDIQVVDFSFSPSLTKDPLDSENYNSNVAVFHGHSDEEILGSFHSLSIAADGVKIFGAVLLSSDYTPLSIVTLDDGGTPPSPLQRPTGFELAIDWYITFTAENGANNV